MSSSSSFTTSQKLEMDKAAATNLKEKLEKTQKENATLQRQMDMLEFVKNEILNDFMKSEETGKAIDSKITEMQTANAGAEKLIKVNGDELRKLRDGLEKEIQKAEIRFDNAFE